MKRRALGALVVALLGTSPALAADATQWINSSPADGMTLDLAVPESPAFTVLGLTPESVVRPATVRELAASLLNGADANGNLQSGIAIDTAPYQVWQGKSLTLYEYREGTFLGIPKWMLAQAQLSVATTKGSSTDDKATRAALGLRWTLFDYGDLRRDDEFLQSLLKAHDKALDELRALSPDDRVQLVRILNVPPDKVLSTLQNMSPDERRAKLPPQLAEKIEWSSDKEIRDLLDDARRRKWNASTWVVGGSPSWVSTSGQVNDLTSQGGAVWSSLALGFPYATLTDEEKEQDDGTKFFRTHSQAIFHIRYRGDQSVPDPQKPGQFFKQDDLLAGARLRLGIDWASLSFEGAYVHEAQHHRPNDDYGRFAVSGDVRIAKDLWLNLSIGGQDGRRGDVNHGFVLSSLKYGFSSERSVVFQ